MISVIPTELKGANSISSSRASLQSSQTNGAADQPNSFHSFLHTAAQAGGHSESDEESKVPSKSDRKKDASDVSANPQAKPADLNNSAVVPQQSTPLPNASALALTLPNTQFDVTKALAGNGTAGCSEVVTAAAPGNSSPQAPQQAVTGSNSSNVQAAAQCMPSLPALTPQTAAGQELQKQAALSGQLALANAAAGSAAKNAQAESQPVKTSEPTQQQLDVPNAATTVAPQLAAEAGLHFRTPGVQALAPVPGVASATKSTERFGSSDNSKGSDGNTPSQSTEGSKGKDQSARVDASTQSTSATGAQQTPTQANSTSNPVVVQATAGHPGADSQTGAIPVAPPRSAEQQLTGSQGAKAAAQATNAPVATGVPAQTDDVQAKVNTARLVQGIQDSELRVGVRTGEFGDIAIHTSMSRSTISAQISVEHGELAKAIAASLPDLKSVLGNRDQLEVRVAMQGQVSPQMDFSGRGAGQDARQQSRGTQNPTPFCAVESNGVQSEIPAINEIDSMRPMVSGRVDLRI